MTIWLILLSSATKILKPVFSATTFFLVVFSIDAFIASLSIVKVILNLKILPFPTSLSRAMSPSNNSTKFFTIAKPKPLPW